MSNPDLSDVLDNLRECPFCSAQTPNISIFKPGAVRVSCPKCLALGPVVSFEERGDLESASLEAARLWNVKDGRKPAPRGAP